MDGVGGLVLALALADGHHRVAGAFHDGADVVEVDVDQARARDHLGQALDALAQHFVGHAQRGLERHIASDQPKQLVVADLDQGVDVRAQRFEPGFRVRAAATGLERERRGDDRYGEDAHAARDLGRDGDRAGAGATAHAAGQKDHVGAFERLADLVAALERGLAPDLPAPAGSEALGELRPDLDLGGCLAQFERLRIGVGGDVFDAFEPDVDHAVDGVRAAAAEPKDLDHGAGCVHGLFLDLATFVYRPTDTRSTSQPRCRS